MISLSLIALINKSEVDIPLTEYIDDHSEMFSLGNQGLDIF